MKQEPQEPQGKRRGRSRRLLRYGIIALLLLVVVALFARRQIGNLLARQLDARLSAAGVYVSWKSADFVAGPGIHFKELTLYRDAAKRGRIAMFGNVTALKGNREWNRWDTVDVKMKDSLFSLGSGGDETALEQVNLHLKIFPGKADLLECRALLQGLRIEARGNYVRPPSTDKSPGKTDGLFDDLDLAWLKTVREWMEFHPHGDEPVLGVDFHSRADGGAADLAISLNGRKFGWRGQEWDSAEASAKTVIGGNPAPVVIDHIRIGHAGKTGEITGTHDSTSGRLSIDKLDCGLDLLALVRAFAPDEVAALENMSATGDWRLQGEGVFAFNKPAESRWNGTVALNGDFAYASGKTSVSLRNPAFGLGLEGTTWSVSAFNAGLWDGDLVMPMTRIEQPDGETAARFETRITLDGASLQSVMSSFGNSQKQPGTVRMDWNGGGGFALDSIKGSGSLGISGAEFFRIPLLGPLHLVFDRIAPGFGKDVASSLTSDHSLSDGILGIHNLHLESKLARIDARGTVDLETNHAHLTAKAKMQGLAGTATALLSSLLEVEGSGPVNDMRWRLKNMPDADIITGAAKTLEKTGGKAIKTTGKTVKGLLGIPGKLLPKK
jgi:hypothetical protein